MNHEVYREQHASFKAGDDFLPESYFKWSEDDQKVYNLFNQRAREDRARQPDKALDVIYDVPNARELEARDEQNVVEGKGIDIVERWKRSMANRLVVEVYIQETERQLGAEVDPGAKAALGKKLVGLTKELDDEINNMQKLESLLQTRHDRGDTASTESLKTVAAIQSRYEIVKQKFADSRIKELELAKPEEEDKFKMSDAKFLGKLNELNKASRRARAGKN